MVNSLPQLLTLAEFLQLPETKPANEYIDGKIIQKPMPKGKHSSIQTEISTTINIALKSQRIARAFSELRCTFGGRSIVPDVAVFTWDKIMRDENGEIADNFELAPDWTIEILSPEQSQTKVTKNILHCLNYGASMGWLIDPQDRTIFAFQPQQQTLVFDEPQQQLALPRFANDRLNLTVETVFNWLLD